VFAVLALLASLDAAASGFVTGRVGVLAGAYGYKNELTSPAGTLIAENKSDSATYGALGGLGLGIGRFFADLGLELHDVPDSFNQDFKRTDVLLTLGAFTGDHWSVFAGLRSASHGEKLFSADKGYSESGPTLGFGYSGRASQDWALGGSLAANYLNYKDETGAANPDVHGIGLSLKLQASRLNSPHSIFLRLQGITGSEAGAAGEFKYSETYLHLGYQATFDLKTW
jgi:hypothetical protein